MIYVAFLSLSSILQPKPIWGVILRTYFQQYRENTLSTHGNSNYTKDNVHKNNASLFNMGFKVDSISTFV